MADLPQGYNETTRPLSPNAARRPTGSGPALVLLIRRRLSEMGRCEMPGASMGCVIPFPMAYAPAQVSTAIAPDEPDCGPGAPCPIFCPCSPDTGFPCFFSGTSFSEPVPVCPAPVAALLLFLFFSILMSFCTHHSGMHPDILAPILPHVRLNSFLV